MTKYGAADYTYTANGEPLTKTDVNGTTTYNYDVFGNLRGATMPDGTSIEYIIDANNRRIGKKVVLSRIFRKLYLNRYSYPAS